MDSIEVLLVIYEVEMSNSKKHYQNTSLGTKIEDCGVLRSVRYLHTD